MSCGVWRNQHCGECRGHLDDERAGAVDLPPCRYREVWVRVAAEIGTMKVTEEIDALETMAIDPIHFLVTPEIRCHDDYAAVPYNLGELDGHTRRRSFRCDAGGIPVHRYIIASLDALYFRDIASGLIKSIMFGITITAVGCHEGLSTGAGAEQVGRSTRAPSWYLFFW